MIQYVILGLLAIFITVLHLNTVIRRQKYSRLPKPPLPLTWHWIMGHALLIKNRAKQFDFHTAEIFKSIGQDLEADTFAVFVGFHSDSCWIISVDIELVSKVMSDHKTFWKVGTRDNPLSFANGVRILGDHGILLEPGSEVWYHKRKMMGPAFLNKNLKCLMNKMNESSNKLCQHLHESRDQKITDMYEVFIKVALEVICTCGFNLEDDFITSTDSTVNDAVNDIFTGVVTAFFNKLTFWMPWKFREEKVSLNNSAVFLRDKIRGHLRARYDAVKAGLDTHHDILSHIIQGNQFSDKLTIEDLVDDFLVFLIAGMETTAITLSILVWYLIKHPGLAGKVRREVKEVFGAKENLDFEDLKKLQYLEQCIKETLRLHPPVIVLFRKNHHSSETVSNVYIPKGTRLIFPIETIQRSEKHWKDPLNFNPERFSPEAISNNKSFSFLPFSAGPRICIGKHFFMMEAKLVISKLLKEFELVDPYPEERELEKTVVLTARPKHGVFVRLTN